MGKVVGVVAMSLAVASFGEAWAQPVATVQKTETRVTTEVGAPEPAAAPAGTVVSRTETTTYQVNAAPVLAKPTPRSMGVPLFPAPAVSSQSGVAAPYGQGLAAAAPVGTPYLRSPAFAGPPVIYMPQTVTRVLLPGTTPYPSNIMSPPASYAYASAPFIRTDIYTSLPYGTFYWPQGYAGTTPVEPQVPAYVTAPASAVLSTQADYTAARYEAGTANAETLNPIASGVNSNLVASTGLTGDASAAPAASVSASPVQPDVLAVQPPAPNLEIPVVPAAPAVTPAAVQPFPVLSDGSAAPAATPEAAAPGLPALPAAPAEAAPGLPALPSATPAAPAPGLPELPPAAATPAAAAPALPSLPGAETSALPALPSSSEVASLPNLPTASATPTATAPNLAPSLPTPATPAAPASEIIVDDKTPGGLSLNPADAWTPSASTAESYEGGSLMATIVPGQARTATFNASIPADGEYEISLWWVGGDSQFRSNAVPVTVNTATGPQNAAVDQTKTGQWNVLGTYQLKAGKEVPVVTISTAGISGSGAAASVSVDAIKLSPR